LIKAKSKASRMQEKVIDSRRIASILLCIGAFFYLGTIIPAASKTMYQLNGYMMASLLFISMSIICFLFSNKCKRNLAKMEEEDSLNQ